MMNRLALASLLAAALATGCGSKKNAASDRDGSADPKVTDHAATDPAAPVKKPLTADFFGKAVAPPGALAKIAMGQPVADARKAAPELFPKPKDDFQLSDAAGLDGVSFGVGLDKDKKAIARMYVTIPAAAKAVELIGAAWGKGKDATDSIGKPRTYWFDAATGWRAYLEKGFGDDSNLELSKYLPAAALLGDGPDALGFAPQGILGATLADLRTRFAGTLVETDAAAAAAEQKKVGDLVGKDLDKQLGAAKPSVRVDLPPTEWGSYWTRIQIDWADDGKVEDVWFDLPYEAYPADKDALRALFDKKWGAPKEAEKYGEKLWIYRADAPSVVVKDDGISHAWNVRISMKKLGKDD
jgi:hypothetical protein